jgi:hypothetical protein
MVFKSIDPSAKEETILYHIQYADSPEMSGLKILSKPPHFLAGPSLNKKARNGNPIPMPPSYSPGTKCLAFPNPP